MEKYFCKIGFCVVFSTFFLSVCSISSNAELLAYEGFDHEPHVYGSVSGLAGGGDFPDYGWAGSWSHVYIPSKSDQAGEILEGSLEYPGVVSHGNKLKFTREVSRRLKTTAGGTNGTVWVSMFFRQNSKKITSEIKLQSGNDDVLSIICQGNGQINLDGVSTGVSVSEGTRFYLLRIDFASEGNTAYLWVNPNLLSEPSASTANATKTYEENWSFDKLFYKCRGGTYFFYLDEIRISTTFKDALRSSGLPLGTTIFVK